MAEINYPDKYKNKLFLSVKDMMEIFGIGENLAYQYLKEAPFRTERVGSKIMIFSNSFWAWYNML